MPELGLGLASGLSQNLVPFGANIPFPKGTPAFEVGRGVGQMLGGIVQMAEGLGMMFGGGAASTTGVGALVGVPALVEGVLFAGSGALAIGAGASTLVDALNANNSFSNGSGSGGDPGGVKLDPTGVPLKPGSSGGPLKGEDFERGTKEIVREENRATHGGKLTCVGCGRDDLIKPRQARGGVARPPNEAHVDHIVPKYKDGNATPANGQVLCPTCNQKKFNEGR